MTRTMLTFEGLMIFHQDRAGHYELGIVDLRGMGHHFPQHDFQIAITPDPHTGSGQWVLGPADLEPFIRRGNHWALEVRDAAGGPVTGISADELAPPNRHVDGGDKRFGWIVNLESGELEAGPPRRLPRARNKLRPIMHFSKGRLQTLCKTGGINLLRPPAQPRDFGYMAGVVGLEIDTSAGETVALRANGVDVFALDAGTSYQVDITNTTKVTTIMSHFHAYYDVVFPGVLGPDRFDFEARRNEPSPDPCANELQIDPELPESMRFLLSPPPYKCGALLLLPGDEPLG
jgi:hypothetical protein